MPTSQLSPIERHEARARARAIYETIKEEFPPENKGKIVAIEVDSGEYFVGATILEATQTARIKHPDKLFHFFRLGFPTAYVWR